MTSDQYIQHACSVCHSLVQVQRSPVIVNRKYCLSGQCNVKWGLSSFSADTNTNDNVYGAVIMARPLREFTQFIWWMQTERQMAANPQTKPADLACESASKLLSSTSSITIYKHCSAQKLILIGQPFVKRFALWYRTIVSLSVRLSVVSL